MAGPGEFCGASNGELRGAAASFKEQSRGERGRGKPRGAVQGPQHHGAWGRGGELHVASQGGRGHEMEARVGLGTLIAHDFVRAGSPVLYKSHSEGIIRNQVKSGGSMTDM